MVPHGQICDLYRGDGAALHLQTTPGFLTVFGVKPNFVIPAAVCVAMHEGEFTGAFYGVLAGVLCDLGGFALAGFNAMILLAACTAVGLLVIYLLRPGVINFVLLLSAVMLGARAAGLSAQLRHMGLRPRVDGVRLRRPARRHLYRGRVAAGLLPVHRGPRLV